MNNSLSKAKWTNSNRIMLDGCSVPIQRWTIANLRFRLSFEPVFWHRLVLVKQLIKRGFSPDRVGLFEEQTTKEVIKAYPEIL